MRFEIYLDTISRAIQMITQPHTLSPIHIPTCCIQPSNLEMRQGLRKLQQQCQKPSTKAHPSNHPVLSLKFPSVHRPPQTLECLMRVGYFFEKRLAWIAKSQLHTCTSWLQVEPWLQHKSLQPLGCDLHFMYPNKTSSSLIALGASAPANMRCLNGQDG